MATMPLARHLLRAKDLVDARYFEPLSVSDLAAAAGLSTALYPHRIKTYFDTTSIERLIHQTRTRNVGVNRMLDKYVRVAETAFIKNPDGVAKPGEFHIRYVLRADVPRLFKIAAALTTAQLGALTTAQAAE